MNDKTAETKKAGNIPADKVERTEESKELRESIKSIVLQTLQILKEKGERRKAKRKKIAWMATIIGAIACIVLLVSSFRAHAEMFPVDGSPRFLQPHLNDEKIIQFQAKQKDIVGKPFMTKNFIGCTISLTNQTPQPGKYARIFWSVAGYHGHGDPDSRCFDLGSYPEPIWVYQDKVYDDQPVTITVIAKALTDYNPVVEVLCTQYRR